MGDRESCTTDVGVVKGWLSWDRICGRTAVPCDSCELKQSRESAPRNLKNPAQSVGSIENAFLPPNFLALNATLQFRDAKSPSRTTTQVLQRIAVQARRWTHSCARNPAGTIGREVSLPELGFRPQSVKEFWWLLGRGFLSGNRSGGRDSIRCAQRLQFGVVPRFSPQFWWVSRLDSKCSKLGDLRSFSSVSGAQELEGKPVEEFVDDAPRRLPLRSSRRTSSSVKQLKDRCFDDIIEREKKRKIILSNKDLLCAEPRRSMTLLDLGMRTEDIGFKGSGRLVVFLKQYPAVFRIHETAEFGKLPWFQSTPEAEAALDEKLEIRKGMDNEVVTKLRKLLMISNDGTLSLSKIAHLGRDLGLPDDFRKSLVYEHPMYFRVVGSKGPLDVEGPKLELVKWSTRLAVTEVEKKAEEQKQEIGLDSLSMSDITTPKRVGLSKFDGVDCPSPYQDGNHLHRRSVQFEKRGVLLVQELLSLALEKRVLVDHPAHFRKEFSFSKKVHGMLIRHPEYFYVSRKGSRDTVFLRGAFEKIHVPGNRKEHCLVDKHPLVLVEEKLAALMEVSPMDSDTTRDRTSFQERDVTEQDRTVPAQGRATTKIPW